MELDVMDESFKWRHYKSDIILQCVRWYCKYGIRQYTRFSHYGSWCVDETYIKVKGQWKYLYRAVDREGKTIDFMLLHSRSLRAATQFLKRTLRLPLFEEKQSHAA